jgi:hypothetical protein
MTACVALSGCKKKPNEVSRSAYIVGPTNDIVNFGDSSEGSSPKSIDLLKSTALISTLLRSGKIKFCSGVLYQAPEGLRILTNHHCFAKTGDDGLSTAELFPAACEGTTVYLGFSPSKNPTPFQTTCAAGSLRTDFQGDLGIFALTDAPPPDYLALTLFEGGYTKGQKAKIIHYPDVKDNMAAPPGSKVNLPKASTTLDNCEVIGPFPRQEWELDRTLPYSIRHTCDLIHGSSGSALVTADTHQILGINWGGIKVTYDDETRTDNAATRNDYVSEFVTGKKDNPNLGRTSSDAVGVENAAGEESEKKKDKKTSWLQTMVKGAGCGVIGESKSSGPLNGLWLLMMPLLLCLFGLGRRKAAVIATSATFVVLMAAPMAKGQSLLLDPATGWANTFLLNSVLTEDYRAMMEASRLPEGSKILGTEDGTNNFIRAKFALQSSAQKQQFVEHRSEIETFQMGHTGFLAGALEESDPRRKLIFSNDLTKEIDAVRDTLPEGKFRQYWDGLASGYAQDAPKCPLSLDEVKKFAAHQKSLTQNGQSVNAKVLIEPVTAWNKTKIRCLVLTMMAASSVHKEEHGYEPLHLLTAMTQADLPISHDNAIRAMYAIRLLQLNRYAETLRVIMRLQDTDVSYRLPYEIVQRIYSRRQKGEGKVALKGI